MEVVFQVPEIDEIGKVELSVGGNAINGGEHLGGDDPGAVLEDDHEIVDGPVATGAEHLEELGLEGQGQVGHGDGAAGAWNQERQQCILTVQNERPRDQLSLKSLFSYDNGAS